MEGEPCKDAKKGGVYERCDMKCDWDGTCLEKTWIETCNCENVATIESTKYNFKVNLNQMISYTGIVSTKPLTC